VLDLTASTSLSRLWNTLSLLAGVVVEVMVVEAVLAVY
jgi:hypothetical protein